MAQRTSKLFDEPCGGHVASINILYIIYKSHNPPLLDAHGSKPRALHSDNLQIFIHQ